MNERIQKSGYYVSTARHHEEWHAGGLHKATQYVAFYFEDDICCRSYLRDSSFFTREDFFKRKKTFEYLVQDNQLKIIKSKGSDFEETWKFEILSQNELKRILKKGEELYHFVLWDE